MLYVLKCTQGTQKGWGAVVLWAYSSAIGAKGPGIESPWRQYEKKPCEEWQGKGCLFKTRLVMTNSGQSSKS